MAVAPQISGYPRMYAAVLCLFWTLCVGTVTTDFGKTINPRFRGTGKIEIAMPRTVLSLRRLHDFEKSRISVTGNR